MKEIIINTVIDELYRDLETLRVYLPDIDARYLWAYFQFKKPHYFMIYTKIVQRKSGFP